MFKLDSAVLNHHWNLRIWMTTSTLLKANFPYAIFFEFKFSRNSAASYLTRLYSFVVMLCAWNWVQWSLRFLTLNRKQSSVTVSFRMNVWMNKLPKRQIFSESTWSKPLKLCVPSQGLYVLIQIGFRQYVNLSINVTSHTFLSIFCRNAKHSPLPGYFKLFFLNGYTMILIH